MSTADVVADESAEQARALLHRLSAQWIALYALSTVVLGAIGAVVWRLVVQLPGYTVAGDGKAYTTQRDLAAVFAADAWFSGIGAVLGAVLGVLAWRWFRGLGWVAPVMASLAALVAGLVTWQLGSLLGPGAFDRRLAVAEQGDFVPISLELHSPVALALWVLCAVLPVLIASSLLRDPEDDAGERGFAAPPPDAALGAGPAGGTGADAVGRAEPGPGAYVPSGESDPVAEPSVPEPPAPEPLRRAE